MKELKFLILCFGLCSCSRTAERKEINENSNAQPVIIKQDTIIRSQTDYSKYDRPIDLDSIYNIKEYLIYEEIDSSKIQRIDFDCVLFICPSKKQIKEMGEGDYRTGKADYKPYLEKQMALCDSIGIKMITAKKQFIKLESEDFSKILDIRKKGMPKWNLILFKKNKTPMVPQTWLTVELLEEYFGKKDN